MKYLILGDLEGRTTWKNIIEKENPDVTIFLGDYVASRVKDIGPADEISTLEELMDLKERSPQAVYLLRGNHDFNGVYYWASCYPKTDLNVVNWLINNRQRFEKNTQWIYQIPDTNIICSHAGIGEKFLENIRTHLFGTSENEYSTQFILNQINSIEPCELFGFTPYGYQSDMSGTSITQPCTWIRPSTLSNCAINDYIQIVGHTRVSDIRKFSEDPEIWLCDALDNNGYLIIEDGKFKPKTL